MCQTSVKRTSNCCLVLETIRYNDQGDRAEEQTHASGSPDAKVDERGNSVPATVPVPPPEQSEMRYAYQVDHNNNWTEKLVESRSGTDQEFRLAASHRRELVYY